MSQQDLSSGPEHLFLWDDMTLLDEGGQYVRIYQDSDCCSPRDDGENFGTFYTWNWSHPSPDGKGHVAPPFDKVVRDLGFDISKLTGHPLPWFVDVLRKSGYAAEVVSKYEHGGVTYSTGTPGQFPDSQWDASYAGLIYVSPQDMRRNWMVDELSEDHYKMAYRMLSEEVDEYSHWCNGVVYGFERYDRDGELVDCQGSFYGDDAMRNGMYDELGMLEPCPYASLEAYVEHEAERRDAR